MSSGYLTRRDAIVVHAAAAAAAIDPEWKDVSAGAPVPRGKSVRVFYGGEREPIRMNAQRVLNAELVAHVIALVAFWPLSELGEDGMTEVDEEIDAFVHELRTRVLGDSQLGGMGTDLEMAYAEPDFLVIANTRYATVEVDFVTDYTEYSIAP